ncbi:hypothetical protein CLV28_1741 [Sediminihabitans luteus]|uniref:Sodium:proton antiporter n=1 Tax=Sediminihabitans luteus TaxID=1138585 RepID=A0A2M9CQT3_9CELL|nr:DUF6328 family protein [Sediminihabitans luteus]PJJ74247.1 hypothetical protein CLV28_1741 [Sediminihabitans luteus]GII99100.1 hypothetical protein Slu03_14780 [Sediminihabitans luteus]
MPDQPMRDDTSTTDDHPRHDTRPPTDDAPDSTASPVTTARERRGETREQQMDRNWNELLQELRVTQTGTQILTGFLLTVPFSARFETLDDLERTTYLVVVLLAVLATGLLVAPVSVHRVLFRRERKAELVHIADRLARAGLAVLALTITGCVVLLVDVVLDTRAGTVAGVCVLAALAVLWVVLPLRVAHGAPPRPSPEDDGVQR